MPPGSRKQRAIPKLVPAKAGTALEAATGRGAYIKLRRNDPALIRRELALNKCGTSNPRKCRGLTIWSGSGIYCSGKGGSRTAPTLE